MAARKTTNEAASKAEQATRRASEVGVEVGSGAKTPAKTSTRAAVPPVGGPTKSNRNVYLSDDLTLRARNAVAWTGLVPGESGSFSALVERAIRAEVERLEVTYNRGESFADAAEVAGLSSAEVVQRLRAASRG